MRGYLQNYGFPRLRRAQCVHGGGTKGADGMLCFIDKRGRWTGTIFPSCSVC